MLKIAICDDVMADRQRVRQHVDEYLELRQIQADVHMYEHPDSMIAECEKLRPQIYILDIVMPMVTGIEAARELRWNQKEAQIIFATSEPSFALESFDVNPINYILKPVDKDKLFETLDLALNRIDVGEEKSVTIKVKGGFSTLYLNDIMYLEYRNHVVTYHMLDGEEISTTTLRIGFAEFLRQNHDENGFVQCHESFAVNIAAIDKLTKTEAVVRSKELVPVSKSKYADVSSSYLNYRFDQVYETKIK